MVSVKISQENTYMMLKLTDQCFFYTFYHITHLNSSFKDFSSYFDTENLEILSKKIDCFRIRSRMVI